MAFASEMDFELYPCSDGKPMADNDLHYRWITTIERNLTALFADDPMVDVHADLFWYPRPRVKGSKEEWVEPQAPDVMVIFGVPKRDRYSYIQHLENNISPQVVFEIYSPSNNTNEFQEKFEFYEKYGVEEYYCIYPDDNALEIWLRQGDNLKKSDFRKRWISPRLKVVFDASDDVLKLISPKWEPFTTFSEERKRRKQAEAAMEALLEKLRAAGIDPNTI